VLEEGVVVVDHFDSEGCNVKFIKVIFHKFIVQESCEERFKGGVYDVAAGEDAGCNLVAMLMKVCEYGKFHSEMVPSGFLV